MLGNKTPCLHIQTILLACIYKLYINDERQVNGPNPQTPKYVSSSIYFITTLLVLHIFTHVQQKNNPFYNNKTCFLTCYNIDFQF